MELELDLTHLNCYDAILDTTLYHEQTMEAIVPDACPDIQRIVSTEGKILLKSKEAQDGKVEVSGTVKACILYWPDGARGVHTMEVTIPFTCSAALPAITPRSKVTACAQMQSADTRSLNPRKVVVRVNLCVAVQVFAPQTSAVCQGVRCEQEQGIQQRCEKKTAYMTTDVKEKPFTFSDTLTLSAGKPSAEKLLKNKVDVVCSESKIIGNKLVFKGEACLQILYASPSGEVCAASFDLPFSQIMEVNGVEEDADSALEVQPTDVQCELSGDEGRAVSVSLGFLAQAVVREEREVEILSDLYSTVNALHLDFETYQFQQLAQRGAAREAVREVVETPTPVRSIIDVSVGIGMLGQSRDGDGMRLTADAWVCVIYLSEEGTLESVTQRIPAQSRVTVPEDSACAFSCVCPGERTATPATGGVEVRFPLEFRYLAQRGFSMAGLAAASADQSAPRDTANQPSVVLRMVGAQEGLWEIAKAYSTTIDDIMKANGLPNEEVTRGGMLLIPKKR